MHQLVLDHHREDALVPPHHERRPPLRHRIDRVQDGVTHAVAVGEHLDRAGQRSGTSG